MIGYEENRKESSDELLKLKSELSKAAESKENMSSIFYITGNNFK